MGNYLVSFSAFILSTMIDYNQQSYELTYHPFDNNIHNDNNDNNNSNRRRRAAARRRRARRDIQNCCVSSLLRRYILLRGQQEEEQQQQQEQEDQQQQQLAEDTMIGSDNDDDDNDNNNNNDNSDNDTMHVEHIAIREMEGILQTMGVLAPVDEQQSNQRLGFLFYNDFLEDFRSFLFMHMNNEEIVDHDDVRQLRNNNNDDDYDSDEYDPIDDDDHDFLLRFGSWGMARRGSPRRATAATNNDGPPPPASKRVIRSLPVFTFTKSTSLLRHCLNTTKKVKENELSLLVSYGGKEKQQAAQDLLHQLNNSTTPCFCNICCESYYDPNDKSSDSDEMDPIIQIKQLPCHHFFHATCIDNWLQRSCSCPICRYDISATQ